MYANTATFPRAFIGRCHDIYKLKGFSNTKDKDERIDNEPLFRKVSSFFFIIHSLTMCTWRASKPVDKIRMVLYKVGSTAKAVSS